MDETSRDVGLFDDPLFGLSTQVQSQSCENETPKEKAKRPRSKSTGAKPSTAKTVAATPKAAKRRSKRALWSLNKTLKKSPRGEVSPWDRAMAKSPSLAKYVEERRKADEEIDKVELNVVEVPHHQRETRINWSI